MHLNDTISCCGTLAAQGVRHGDREVLPFSLHWHASGSIYVPAGQVGGQNTVGRSVDDRDVGVASVWCNDLEVHRNFFAGGERVDVGSVVVVLHALCNFMLACDDHD